MRVFFSHILMPPSRHSGFLYIKSRRIWLLHAGFMWGAGQPELGTISSQNSFQLIPGFSTFLDGHFGNINAFPAYCRQVLCMRNKKRSLLVSPAFKLNVNFPKFVHANLQAVFAVSFSLEIKEVHNLAITFSALDTSSQYLL